MHPKARAISLADAREKRHRRYTYVPEFHGKFPVPPPPRHDPIVPARNTQEIISRALSRAGEWRGSGRREVQDDRKETRRRDVSLAMDLQRRRGGRYFYFSGGCRCRFRCVCSIWKIVSPPKLKGLSRCERRERRAVVNERVPAQKRRTPVSRFSSFPPFIFRRSRRPALVRSPTPCSPCDFPPY